MIDYKKKFYNYRKQNMFLTIMCMVLFISGLFVFFSFIAYKEKYEIMNIDGFSCWYNSEEGFKSFSKAVEKIENNCGSIFITNGYDNDLGYRSYEVFRTVSKDGWSKYTNTPLRDCFYGENLE